MSDPPDENGSPRPARKSSTSTLLLAFRNLTSSTRTKPIPSQTSPLQRSVSVEVFSLPQAQAANTLPKLLHLSQDSENDPVNSNSTASDASFDTSTAEYKFAAMTGNPDVDELLPKLAKDQSLPVRLDTAQKVVVAMAKHTVKDVMSILAPAHLLLQEPSADAVQAGFNLLLSCVKKTSLSSTERLLIWRTVADYAGEEQLQSAFQVIQALTDNGRNIDGLETELLGLLIRFLGSAFEWVKKSRRGETRQDKDSKKPKKDPTPENLEDEQFFHSLFQYTSDVIKFNATVLSAEDMAKVLEQVTHICRMATLETDMSNATQVMITLVIYTKIDAATFKASLELLCDVYRQMTTLKKSTWAALTKIFGSHLRYAAVTDLLEILQIHPSYTKTRINTLRGAFFVLSKLLRRNGRENLPKVPLRQFVSATTAALSTKDRKLASDVLDCIRITITDEALRKLLIDEVDWSDFTNTIKQCAFILGIAGHRDQKPQTQDDAEPSDKSKRVSHDKNESFSILNFIVGKITESFSFLDPIQQDQVMDLFLGLNCPLPDDASHTIVLYASDRGTWVTSRPTTLAAVSEYVISLVNDNSRPTALRVQAVQAFSTSLKLKLDETTATAITFAKPVLDKLPLEENTEVLEALMEALQDSMTDLNNDTTFEALMQLVSDGLLKRPAHASQSSPVPLGTISRPSPCRIIAKHVIRIFLSVMNLSAVKATALYRLLLDVAASPACDADARICALKLLFRVRATDDHRIYVASQSESESIAAVLCRTVDTGILSPQNLRADFARETRTISTGSVHAAVMAKPKGLNVKRPVPPLWFYPGPKALPQEPSGVPSPVLFSTTTNSASEDTANAFKPGYFLETVMALLLKQDTDWEVYSYILVHLGAQLKNRDLFVDCKPQIKMVRNILCDQIRSQSFHEPPSHTSLRKAEVAVCLFHILTTIIPYSPWFAKSEEDDIVRSFMSGIGTWDHTSKWCIHALSVCCHELPLSTVKALDGIIQRMSQIITQPHIAIHILEFLCGLARLPDLFKNFREEQYKMVFGVSFRYLQSVRDQRDRQAEAQKAISQLTSISKRHSDSVRDIKSAPDDDLRAKRSSSDELPQYVYALAFHVITFWFMALKLRDRPLYMPWIARNLTYVDDDGQEVIEDQGLVTMDMMERIAYTDRDETCYKENFAPTQEHGEVMKKTWILGLSLLTIETAGKSGRSQITRRRASGTRYLIHEPALTAPPKHQVPLTNGLDADAFYTSSYIGVLPEDVLQEMYSSLSLATLPTHSLEAPTLLPDDDAVKRTIAMFDRNSTVDGHKIGIIFVDKEQKTETEILANSTGSLDYTDFLGRMGTLVRLKGASYNTQGLDRSDDMDGKFTYAWRDRSTEVVYHVATMMPTDLENDPQCVNKKRHTGNDFVNIIWNESGAAFNFNTFPSDFSYIYIVITPQNGDKFVRLRHALYENVNASIDAPGAAATPVMSPGSGLFYQVQVISAPGFPSISPADEPKIVSFKSLGPFVRLLALNASFFSLVWFNKAGGEHVSAWRNRLREIKRLRERYVVPPASEARGSSPTGYGVGSLQVPPGNSGRASQRVSIFGGTGSEKEAE
jgi:hypothetical protein